MIEFILFLVVVVLLIKFSTQGSVIQFNDRNQINGYMEHYLWQGNITF